MKKNLLFLQFLNLWIKPIKEILEIKCKTNIFKKDIDSTWRNLRNIDNFQNLQIPIKRAWSRFLRSSSL